MPRCPGCPAPTPQHPPPLPYTFPPHSQGQPPSSAWGCAALCPITKDLGPPPSLGPLPLLGPLGPPPSLSTWAARRQVPCQDAGTRSVHIVAQALGAQTSWGSLRCLLSLGGCSASSAWQSGFHQGCKGPLLTVVSWLGQPPPLWGPSSWALRASPVALGSARFLHPFPARMEAAAAGNTVPGWGEPQEQRTRAVASAPARNRDFEAVNKELQ